MGFRPKWSILHKLTTEGVILKLGERLKEPSTWAGIAAILGAGANAWATRDPNAIAAVLAGAIAMFVPERAAK
jgi:hypothetical protein